MATALMVLSALILATIIAAAWRLRRPASASPSAAFFHPFCDTGGGGERVLWTAVAALLQKTATPNHRIVVYARDAAGSPERILAAVKTQFNIDIRPDNIQFVYLSSWRWLEAKRYKRLTLLLQSLGAIITGIEALTQVVPDIFIDTVGFTFIIPIVKLFGVSKTVSYVHYPTISTDMLDKVAARHAAVNNDQWIAHSLLLSRIKWMYYLAFSWVYGLAGSFSDIIMVNSSWTLAHINAIWRAPHRTTVVFPPCDTKSLAHLPLNVAAATTGDSSKHKKHPRQRIILSVAQFRPEKNHALQIDAFATLLQQHPEYAQQRGTAPSTCDPVSLVLVGSVRNDDDAALVNQLRAQISRLGLQDSVTIKENVSYTHLLELLSISMIGLHTMWNEHFGISIIEYMAAGVVPLAHQSGGPMMDIVVPFHDQVTGVLATTKEEYASQLHTILSLSTESYRDIQQAARQSVVDRFSADAFASAFLDRLDLNVN